MIPADEPDVVGELERAWAEPQYTRAIQPEIDVSRVLHERYESDVGGGTDLERDLVLA